MSIQVNVEPTVLEVSKSYKGIANIDGKEWKFHYHVSKKGDKVESNANLDLEHYENIDSKNEIERWDEMNVVEKQIEENINYRDIW